MADGGEGGDVGRQQVVVMHRATFLATLIRNKGLRVTLLRRFCGDGAESVACSLKHQRTRTGVSLTCLWALHSS